MPAFSSSEFSLRVLSNPSIIQHEMLTTFQNETLNGEVVFKDPNNGFVLQLEAISSMTAALSRAVEAELKPLYPLRAELPEELYKHITDFDYIQTTASPCSTTIQLVLDRDFLINKSVPYNDNYNKIIIPASSVLNIGGNKFGLYYPIDILVNKRTKNIIVTYDTSIINPLYNLQSNIVEFYTYSRNGLNLISLYIPVYQFERVVYTEPVTKEQGFTSVYPYMNKFYAIRVYTFIDAKWKELSITFSEDVYDRSVATARVIIASTANRLKVSIPQIYFNKRLIGNQVRVEIYTTQGETEILLSDIDINECTMSFDLNSTNTTNFSTMLGSMSTAFIIPTEKNFRGGSDPIDFETIREQVIYGSIDNAVPISPMDLKAFAAKRGYALTKEIDSVTNRIIYAHKKLTDTAGNATSVTHADIQVTTDIINKTQSILQFDETVVLLPTVIYKYIDTNRSCIPVNDQELSVISNLIGEELAVELNNTDYLRQPFHLVLYANERYPLSKTFNLNSPAIKTISFIQENNQVTAQLTVVSASIEHKNSGTGGYTLRLAIHKTADIKTVSEDYLSIILSVTEKSGNTAYLKAVKVSTTEAYDIYEVNFVTTYKISSDRYIECFLYDINSNQNRLSIPLEASFTIHALAHPDVISGTYLNDLTISEGLPDYFKETFIGLVKQRITVQFGKDLSDGIYNRTTAVWDSERYATWPENIYHVYPHDVYEMDETGTIKLSYKDGKLSYNKLHEKGEIIRDNKGEPIIRYAQGSYRRDENNNLIILAERELTYYVNALMFDGRLFVSTDEDDVTYLKSLPNEITSSVDAVKEMSNSLIEKTSLYYRPFRTIGSALFSLGDTVTKTIDLNLSFYIRYFVPTSVKANQKLLDIIREKTYAIINTHIQKDVISLTAISDELRITHGENITSIDVLGINEDPLLQTLFVNETGISPMIGTELVYKQDGSFALEKKIKIDFSVNE